MTAVTGVGGGLILIALMPGFVSAAALIPVHAVVQLTSNVSRAAFAYRSIHWPYVGLFLTGSILGGVLGWQLIRFINLDYITLLVALFMLLSVWLPQWANWLLGRHSEMFGIGVVQTGLGTVGGVTGPLATASLIRRGCGRDQVVTTTAVQMSLTHLTKIIAFSAVGVSIAGYWLLIVAMSVGVVIGSWLGTHSRARLDERLFARITSFLLTVLAVRMIYITLV